MGFTINEVTNVELHYKEIASVNVAINEYIRLYKDKMNDDLRKDMETANRKMMSAMYNHPDNDIPNGDN